MLLGVKLIDVATDSLSDLVDGKLAVVEVELLNVTIVDFRDRNLGDVLFDNVAEEVLELLGRIEPEPLGDALVVKFIDEEVGLLRSKLVDEVPESPCDALVDKLTEVGFELLFANWSGLIPGHLVLHLLTSQERERSSYSAYHWSVWRQRHLVTHWLTS